jgi:hypothetical protein
MRVRTRPVLFDTQPLRRGGCLLAIALPLASLSPAAAQQYPPPSYPSYPSYPDPGAAPPSYAPSYGGPAAFAPQAPPPPQYEAVPPPPPGPAMIWTAGYWNWAGRWVWVPGRYVARPYARAVWVPGQWRPRHGGWVWVPGHWRG